MVGPPKPPLLLNKDVYQASDVAKERTNMEVVDEIRDPIDEQGKG